MFYFDPVNDIDLDSYAYELYDNPAGTGAAVATGRNKANVFTISVTNSTDSTSKTYYGRVAVVNSAGTVGTYTSLVSSGETPLIGEQYITSLTAAKITAGTIGAHTITLGGNSSVIKSSTYDGTFDVPTGRWTTGGAGWLISGNGQAIFDATQIRGSLTASSINLDANNYWLSSTVGPPSTPITFKVGNATNFFEWDGTNVRTTGTVITNATVSGGTVGGINAGAGATANRFYIGAGTFNNANTAFYVDSAGQFSLKNKLVWTGDALTIDGTVTIGGTTASTVVSNAATGAGDPATRINAGSTTITGSKIRTGSIDSNNFVWTGSTTYSVAGTRLDLEGGQIISKNFRIDGSGNASFAGSITSGSTITGSTLVSDNESQGVEITGGYIRGTRSNGIEFRSSGSTTYTYIIGGVINTEKISLSNGTDDIEIEPGTGNYSISAQKTSGVQLDSALRLRRSGSTPGSLFVAFERTNGTDVGKIRYTLGSNSEIAYITSSDQRLKHATGRENNSLSIINKLKPKYYYWLDSSPDNEVYGLFAQEVYDLIPNAVSVGDNLEPMIIEDGQFKVKEVWGIDNSKIVPYLIGAIQQLSKKVDELESRLV
jgi:hypothetical protein